MNEDETIAWDLRQSRIEFIGKLVVWLRLTYMEAKQDKYNQKKQLALVDALDVLWREIRIYCDSTQWEWKETEMPVQQWLDQIEDNLEQTGIPDIKLERYFIQLRSLHDYIEEKRVNEANLDIPKNKNLEFDAT